MSQVSNKDLSGAEEYHFTLQMDVSGLADARAHFSRLFARLTLEEQIIHQLLIALDEAIQNIVRHAYKTTELPGRLDVTIRYRSDELIIELRDYARPADLTRIRPVPRQPQQHGGYGLHLIYATMDDVNYQHAADGDGNILTMRKHLG